MALGDVIKKKQETGESKSGNGEKKNLLEDVRVVIAVLVILILALIGLIVYGNMNIKKTTQQIDDLKIKYNENQIAINQLLALQMQSDLYKERKEEYDKLISNEPINQTDIMIDLENTVENYDCALTAIDFDEITSTGLLNQVNVYISITGEFDDIMRFCRDTVSAEQIKRVDKINLTMASKEDNTMTADITIVEFSKG